MKTNSTTHNIATAKLTYKVMTFYKTIIIIYFSLLAFSSAGQKCGDYDHPCRPGDTLVDRYLKMKIIADTSHKCIIALTLDNTVLWQTNPWKNESSRTYDSSINDLFRSNRISAFFLDRKKTKSDPYIYLRFSNSAIAAVIERKNGKFHLIGVM